MRHDAKYQRRYRPTFERRPRRSGPPLTRSPSVNAEQAVRLPLPVWSSNKQRHRLSRTGNRQLNAALHRIAMTQARMHLPARELLARRKSGGDGGMEALRILKRRLSDVVFRAMLTDQGPPTAAAA